MGNFHSGAAGGEVPYPELRDCFTDLANLIRQFPLVRVSACADRASAGSGEHCSVPVQSTGPANAPCTGWLC